MSDENTSPVNVGLQQAQLNNQIAASRAGSGGEGGPGVVVDTLLRFPIIGNFLKFFGLSGINGHSTTGLDGFLSPSSVFSGLSLQGKSIITSQLDTRGGVAASVLSNFTGPAGSHTGEAAAGGGAPIGASGDAGGGGGSSDGGGGDDAKYAALNTIPSAAFEGMATEKFQVQHMTDAAPPPRASRGEGGGGRDR